MDTTPNAAPSRRCAQDRCPEAAMPRRGTRGPKPRYCQMHTQDRKRAQDRRPRGVRPAYRHCCIDWQQAGNSGLCPQHELGRDFERDSRAAYMERFSHAGERKNLVTALDIRSGVHVEHVPAAEPETPLVSDDPAPVRIVYPSEMEKAGFVYCDGMWFMNDAWHRLWMEDPEEFDLIVEGEFQYA